MIIELNKIKLFYEKYGDSKESIILLHGNGENHNIFDKLIESLSKNFTVYAIDSRGHGKSSKVKEINYNIMAEDIITFIEELKIVKPILYGFSDGGIIGLLIAIRKPYILKKLIVSGANTNPYGINDKIYKFLKVVYYITRSSKIKMMVFEPNILEEDLQKIEIPVIVIVGSNDIIKMDHTKEFTKHINNSVLKVILNENHSSYIIHSKKIYNIIKDYIY